MHAQLRCRYFLGDRPCQRPGADPVCNPACPQKDLIQTRVLVIHLGALGAVVRATALLEPIRKKYPEVHITWVTQAPADQLLRGHPRIDRALTLSQEDLLRLRSQSFDVVIINDKSPVASGIMSLVRAREVKGFITDEVSGAIIPATEAARELWEIGLDNHRKFHVNRKSEIHLMAEAVELNPADLVGYELPLQGPENEMRRQRKEVWSRRGQAFVIGLNTGCAATLPYKKLSVQGHRDLIRHMLAQWGDRVQIVLLGGREDTFRNDQIAEGLPVIKSPTDQGLRDGLVSVAACDSVFTGDSLGMHLAIAARVWTVAWFGPTCDHEIDFFGRGLAVRAQVPCSPCWKRSCNRPEMCYDHVDSRDVVAAIESSPTWSTWLALRRNPSHSDAGEDGSLRLYPDSLPR